MLGTLIPVDVRRNALLMVRFFTYIDETMRKRGPFRSLDEIWQHTVATNAVNELISASKEVRKWAHAGGPDKNVLSEFMLTRSVGRLRAGHVYADTETILTEIADERGFGEVLPSSPAGLAAG